MDWAIKAEKLKISVYYGKKIVEIVLDFSFLLTSFFFNLLGLVVKQRR